MKADAPPDWVQSTTKTNVHCPRCGHRGQAATGQQASGAGNEWRLRYATVNLMYDATRCVRYPTEQKLLICGCDFTYKTQVGTRICQRTCQSCGTNSDAKQRIPVENQNARQCNTINRPTWHKVGNGQSQLDVYSNSDEVQKRALSSIVAQGDCGSTHAASGRCWGCVQALSGGNCPQVNTLNGIRHNNSFIQQQIGREGTVRNTQGG